MKIAQSCLTLRPHGLYHLWNSAGQNTGVGRLSLLQGIFLTQGSIQGLLHCSRILYLTHQTHSQGMGEDTSVREGRVQVWCLLKVIRSSYWDHQKQEQKAFPLEMTSDVLWLLQWIFWACQPHVMPWTSTTSSKMTSPWTSCRSLTVWPLFMTAWSKSTTIWSTSLSAWICVSIGCWMFMIRTYGRLSPDSTTGGLVYRTVTV